MTNEITIGTVVYCEGASALLGDVVEIDAVEESAEVHWRSTFTTEALDDLIINDDQSKPAPGELVEAIRRLQNMQADVEANYDTEDEDWRVDMDDVDHAVWATLGDVANMLHALATGTTPAQGE
jgi:hypothetical protein